MKDSYKIAASVVLYNSPVDDITNIINSFTAVPGNNKLFLIDNSAKNSSEVYAGFSNKIAYIHTNKNLGFGSAHNIAMRKSIASGYQYHFIINPDVVFEPDTIMAICDFMEGNAHIGAVMPKVVDNNGHTQYLCKLLPTPYDLFVRRFLPQRLARKRRYLFEMRFTGYNQIMEVPFLSGCFMALRKEALEKCGLFDESFFMYGEDIDFSRRIHEKFETMFYPKVSIVHGYEAASYKSFKMLKIHTKSIIRYFNKWGWFFDKRREEVNKTILAQFKYPNNHQTLDEMR